jgi:acyl-CoA thioesterase II
MVDDLATLLDLEVLDMDLFRGQNADHRSSRTTLYGGQVTAQALRAAALTVPDGRFPHSLHGYFLRAGSRDTPVVFHVDRDRDGGSFSARRVLAMQRGEVIFSMLASFHTDETSGTYEVVPRASAPPPETVEPKRVDSLLHVREVTPTSDDDGTFSDRMWVRSATPLVDDRVVQACALAYVSDLGSGFGQLAKPGLPSGGPSIDHAMWFHSPMRADEWTLLDLSPAKAGGARGVYLGSLRDQAGTLGAMLAQEQLLRPGRSARGPS